jgi:hypothetical protein
VERRLPLEVEAVLFGRSESTKRAVAKHISSFLRWVGKPLREVSREDVDRYLLTELAGRKRSAQLLLLYLAKVFDYIGKRDLAEHCRERKRGIRSTRRSRGGARSPGRSWRGSPEPSTCGSPTGSTGRGGGWGSSSS